MPLDYNTYPKCVTLRVLRFGERCYQRRHIDSEEKLSTRIQSPEALGAAESSEASGLPGVPGLPGLLGLSGLSGTSGIVSLLKTTVSAGADIAVVCHFIRDQTIAFCSHLKNNLDSLHRCVHAVNHSKLVAGFFSHLIPIGAGDVARSVRDAIEDDLSFCVIDCLGTMAALNGIPVFVNLDKREGEHLQGLRPCHRRPA